ncbi:MAG: RES family NAD+ phosphorylase, partial [Chloroflexi bacterium]|nr:RES family NAD+ phosphorylase [Chloroflexota bacterium]
KAGVTRNKPEQKTLSVTMVPVQGQFSRLVSATHREHVLSTEGSLQYGGRYNPPGEFGAIYLGESEAVCQAEMERAAHHRGALRPMVLARVQVRLHKVADLRDAGTLQALGTRAGDILHATDYSTPRRLARLLRAAGAEGLLVPSVTGKGSNLVIFPENLSSDSGIEVQEVLGWPQQSSNPSQLGRAEGLGQKLGQGEAPPFAPGVHQKHPEPL